MLCSGGKYCARGATVLHYYSSNVVDLAKDVRSQRQSGRHRTECLATSTLSHIAALVNIPVRQNIQHSRAKGKPAKGSCDSRNDACLSIGVEIPVCDERKPMARKGLSYAGIGKISSIFV